MKLCPRCKTKVEDSATSCPNCGSTKLLTAEQIRKIQAQQQAARQHQAQAQQQGQFVQQPQQNNQAQVNKPVSSGYSASDFTDAPEQPKGKNAKAPVEKASKPETCEVLSVKDYLISLVLMIIPLVNVGYLVMTLKKKDANPSKKNLLIAYIILFGVALAISLALATLVGNAPAATPAA